MVIANARRYREEQETRAYLETIINTSPIGVAVFNAKTGELVKLNLDKEVVKTNRKIALCQQDKLHGRYHRLNQLDLPENTVTVIYLEQVSFPLYLLRQTYNRETARIFERLRTPGYPLEHLLKVMTIRRADGWEYTLEEVPVGQFLSART